MNMLRLSVITIFCLVPVVLCAQQAPDSTRVRYRLSPRPSLNDTSAQHAPLLITKFVVDTAFRDTLSFTKRWEYPWYMEKIGAHRFYDMSSGKYVKRAPRLYYTASCTTDHQGAHQVNYCSATLRNDVLVLTFLPELPAYFGSLEVVVRDAIFSSQFAAEYLYTIPGEQIRFETTDQKLVLNKTRYSTGDTVMGYIEISFTESLTVPNKAPIEKRCYWKGFFKTPLLSTP